MTFKQELARSIRVKRLDAGLTQSQLGQKIGKTSNCVSLYETARRVPSIEVMSLISDVLNASLDDMVPHVTYDIEVDEDQTTIFDVIGEEDD